MSVLSQDDLWALRGLVQKCGWGEFMGHVAGLMAEQADKVQRDSEQDKNLFACHNTLTALRTHFAKCGHFDYRKHGELLEPHQLEILNKYPPGGDK